MNNNVDDYISKGKEFFYSGNLSKAKKYFDKAVEMSSDKVKICIEIGKFCFDENNDFSLDNEPYLIKKAEKIYSIAENYFDIAVKLSDNKIKIYFEIGMLFKTTCEYITEKYFNKSIKKSLNKAEYCFKIGKFYFSGNQAEAEKYFNKAIEFAVNKSKFCIDIGKFCFEIAKCSKSIFFKEQYQLNYYESAVKYFAMVCEIDSNYSKSRYWIGKCCFEEAEIYSSDSYFYSEEYYNLAETHFAKARELGYKENGDLEKAEKDLKKVRDKI
ncbi:MAG: hypothetical protein IJI84_01890 [Clostridia bacterium]|nr:hypothetical protein [Clostridia bacterium]